MSRLELPKVSAPVEARSHVRGRARGRAGFVGVLLGLALTGIAARGALLCLRPDPQTIRDGAMMRYDQVTLRAARGEILDREGRRLATSVDTPSVAVDPFVLKDQTPEQIDALAQKVADILDVPQAEIAERMRRPGRYVKLATRIHPAVAAKIDALNEPAIWTHRDPHRYYPEENLASQVVGFVDAGGSGRSGLEQALDSQLRGGSVVVQRRRDRKGLDVDRPAAVGLAANQGLDVHTTLDRRIQHIAEEALRDVVTVSAPVSASVVVVDVKTGDILALANVPEFNPNAMPEDPNPRKNHIVVDAIEPGSIFKPFTIAAAVDLGIVTPDDKVDCEGGYYQIGRARIRDDHPHGMITVGEVMKYSSNIGVAKLAFRMGAESFVSYLHAFGFGEATGIPLPGERRGRIRDPKTIKPIELATTAFGQGTTATPLQLAMGIATLGNGGVRMKPRLVTSIEDAYGVPDYVQRPQIAQRAISEITAAKTLAMMSLVTEAGGTGTRARVDGYKVAGKTGTAQKVKDGRYSEARISSFVGLVPADNPVLAIAVIVDEPTIGSKYGGTVAGPAFARIAGESLRHLGVPQDPALIETKAGKALAASVQLAEDEAGLPAVEAAADEPLDVPWDGGAWTVPDLSGASLRDVLASLEGTGVRIEMRGSGVVISQTPEAGLSVAPGGQVSVVLQ